MMMQKSKQSRVIEDAHLSDAANYKLARKQLTSRHMQCVWLLCFPMEYNRRARIVAWQNILIEIQGQKTCDVNHLWRIILLALWVTRE